jgi:hypothetical protein
MGNRVAIGEPYLIHTGKRPQKMILTRCDCGDEKAVGYYKFLKGEVSQCKVCWGATRITRQANHLCLECEITPVAFRQKSKDGLRDQYHPFCMRCFSARKALNMTNKDELGIYAAFAESGSVCAVCAESVDWFSYRGVHLDHAHINECNHDNRGCVKCFRGFTCEACNLRFLPEYERIRVSIAMRIPLLEAYLASRPLAHFR